MIAQHKLENSTSAEQRIAQQKLENSTAAQQRIAQQKLENITAAKQMIAQHITTNELLLSPSRNEQGNEIFNLQTHLK